MRTLLLALLFVAAVTADLAPLLHADSPTLVPGQYIVVLNEGHNAASRDIHINALKAAIQADNDHSEIKFKYAIGSFVGFSAKLSEKFLKSELAHPEVKYIEADQVVSIYDQPAAPASPNAVVTQTGATWGIDRVSQRKLPLDGLYVYDSSAGAGVDVYVLDTGILTTHVDFEDRAEFVFSSIEGQTEDGNGHGTHCAGTIAGKEYGIAKLANLKAVKVLSDGGSGTWAGVIAGVDFVTNNRSLVRPAVASMSLGGGATAALDEAVNASIASGVPYSIAAGNSNGNACLFSPAGVPLAVTVGSTDDTDTRSYFSNYGKCVDIFAPGSNVKSDYIGSNTATAVLSGTSMATPHVTGVIAIKLGLEPTLTPADITYWLVSVATNDTIINVGADSPNSLLYSPYD